jgi:hypothetical protein
VGYGVLEEGFGGADEEGGVVESDAEVDGVGWGLSFGFRKFFGVGWGGWGVGGESLILGKNGLRSAVGCLPIGWSGSLLRRRLGSRIGNSWSLGNIGFRIRVSSTPSRDTCCHA